MVCRKICINLNCNKLLKKQEQFIDGALRNTYYFHGLHDQPKI